MHQELAYIALVVKDYDEAISFYTKKLLFTLVEDTTLSDSKRWVLIRPPGSKGCCLLLAKAANESQINSVGNQTGGRVFLFLHTDDIRRDNKRMLENGIIFTREPAKENLPPGNKTKRKKSS